MCLPALVVPSGLFVWRFDHPAIRDLTHGRPAGRPYNARPWRGRQDRGAGDHKGRPYNSVGGASRVAWRIPGFETHPGLIGVGKA